MRLIFLTFLLLSTLPIPAQEVGRKNSVSINFLQPLGEFGDTHAFGLAAMYERSPGIFGQRDSTGKKKFSFTYGGGIAWNKGKRETAEAVPSYEYGDFTFAFGSAGVQYLICRTAHIGVSAGPALARYNKVNRFNLYGGTAATWYAGPRIGIRAGFHFLKESKAAWMAMANAGVSYVF